MARQTDIAEHAHITELLYPLSNSLVVLESPSTILVQKIVIVGASYGCKLHGKTEYRVGSDE